MRKLISVVFLSILFAVTTCLLTFVAGPGVAQTTGQVGVTGARNLQIDGVPREVQRGGWSESVLRFITEDDYPPFNYRDEEGVLTGFNIDLARSICEELGVECQMQTAKWAGLVPAVNSGQADVVAASLAVSVENLRKVDFTNRYFQMPARFASKKGFDLEDMVPEELEGETIGVLKGTAHEAYLKDFFFDAEIISFATSNAARSALREGKISLLFGDGVGLMFWVNGLDSGGCCVLRGGAFTEARYFGEGIGFAVKKGNRALRETLNDALVNVRKSGKFEELYLRYFPLRFY